MKIIGHRGIAGLALENSRASLEQAVRFKLDAIEIDVRHTKDDQLVLCHDGDLQAMAGITDNVADKTLRQLKKIPLLDGSHIITLDEALKILGSTPVIVELKDDQCIGPLGKVLARHPKAHISIASFKLQELAALRELYPSLTLYGLEHSKPIEIIQLARALKLNGIGLNFWLMNPITYWLARRHKIAVYVYTVNSPLNAWFLSLFYPGISICTDAPQKLRPRLAKANHTIL